MNISTAAVPTPNASRYLQQLCKHWVHKFPVEFTPEAGTIELPRGRTSIRADADTLHVEIEAGDAEALERLQGVVADHILRFAFREELRFEWTPAVRDR